MEGLDPEFQTYNPYGIYICCEDKQGAAILFTNVGVILWFGWLVSAIH